MIKRFVVSSFAVVLFASVACGQHSDIRFSYEDDEIILREGIVGHTDGFQIYTSNFPTEGFSERFTENPGYASELVNNDNVEPGDQISIEFLESNTFGSFLTYYDPATDSMMPTDASITIEDNGGTNTPDLVISNLETMGLNPQIIQTADEFGQVHSHIDYFLSENAVQGGAYGILLRLVTDNPAFGNSPSAWLIFNYGMDPNDFTELAIPAFAGTFVLGDVNGDGAVNLLDVGPFVDLLTNGEYLAAADINGDGVVNLLDVGPFVELLSG